jgi:phospholipase/carboxylesterase
MADNDPQVLELETGSDPVYSIIFLHGLGADCHDFESLPNMLDLPVGIPIRFVLPDAPMRPITINNGMVMRGWYDIGFDIDRGLCPDGLEDSARMIRTLLDREEQRGVAAERILLGGFSQGGAVSLYLGLRYEKTLGGIIGLSTYMRANQHTPIFLAHGLHDPVLALQLAESSRDLLSEQGYAVNWHTYPMPHSLCQEEVTDLSAWLGRILTEPPSA